jgi:hypothetical protein
MDQPGITPLETAAIPRQVDRIEALPSDLYRLADLFLPDGEKVRSILEIPGGVFKETNQNFHNQEERALVFTQHGLLHVLPPSTRNQAGRAIYIDGQELLYLQLSLIQLYGRLELVAGMNSQLVQTEMEYNTKGHDLLQPNLFKFLKKSWGKSPTKKLSPEIVSKTERDLEHLDPRYSNSLRSFGLQPEERLLGLVFQPTIRERSWIGLPRQISFPVLLALTEHQVITLEEKETENPQVSGWLVTFIPRLAIEKFGMRPSKVHQILTFFLKRNDVQAELEFHLEQPQMLDWNALWGNEAL